MKNETSELMFKLCYLASCVFHNSIPDIDNFSSSDLRMLYELSKMHSTESLVYKALEKTTASRFEPQLMAEWKTDRDRAVRNSILFDAERKKLIDFLEENKIWYVQLKGIIIKSLYPGVGLRQMADNDFLFDPEFRGKIRDYFVAEGYDIKSFGKGCHDSYVKKPVYNFEMHTYLFEDRHMPAPADYFNDSVSRLLNVCEGRCERDFSRKDFYLYFIAHSYRHYSTYGIGIRFLFDLYLIINKYYEAIDKASLNNSLEQLGLRNFERTARELSVKLFCCSQSLTEDDLNNEESKMLEYIFFSGTYGIKSNKIRNQFKSIQGDGQHSLLFAKIKYYQTRLFPDEHWYSLYCPFCFKHKWAKPFYTVFRVLRALVFRRERIKDEYKVISSND